MELVVAVWSTGVNEDGSDASVPSGAPGQMDAAGQSRERHQYSFELFGYFLKDRAAEEFAHAKHECCFPQCSHTPALGPWFMLCKTLGL